MGETTIRDPERLLLENEALLRRIAALELESQGLKSTLHAIGDGVSCREDAEALKRSVTRLRRLDGSGLLGIAYWNTLGHITDANDRFLELVGYTRDDLEAGRINWADMTPPEFRHVDEASVAELKATGISRAPFEKEYVRKDGSCVPIIGAGVMLDEDRTEGMTIVLDITERKRAVAELRASERRYRTLVEALPHLVWTCRADGACDYLSPRWVEFTGIPVAEQLGYNWIQQLHPDDRDRVMAKWSEVDPCGDVFNIEFRIRRADGVYRWYKTRAVPFFDDDGGLVQWFGSHTDIDESKRAEEEIRVMNAALERRVADRTEQLEQSNKELEAFSYSVSHDLRAPLRAIDGFTRILSDEFGPTLGDEGRRVCSIIRENSGRMGRLIDDLLGFSRIGRVEMQQARIDMASMARAVFHELTTPESRERIDFQLEAMPLAFGDPSLMRQVWMNLLGNALKFSSKRERAVITVCGETKAREDIYVVRDNGAGFDMHYLSNLFGVFQRLHSTREFEGTGVGLALVQRVIRRHGGRIWAHGEIDHGATFSFALPNGSA